MGNAHSLRVRVSGTDLADPLRNAIHLSKLFLTIFDFANIKGGVLGIMCREAENFFQISRIPIPENN
jgi:hypothetical protein